MDTSAIADGPYFLDPRFVPRWISYYLSRKCTQQPPYPHDGVFDVTNSSQSARLMDHSDSLKGFAKDKDNNGITNMSESGSLFENIEAMNFHDNAKTYTNLGDECSSDLGGRILQQGVIENARKQHNSGNDTIKEVSSN